MTAQSLIAYFIGGNRLEEAKKVCKVIIIWSIVTGFLLALVMSIGQKVFIAMLVPADAVSIFVVPWLIAAFSQPLNSLAFATDGIHWGTGDFAYLRNGMIAATSTGLIGIYAMESFGFATLINLWIVTVLWIAVRSLAGMIRVWPGIGKSPWK